MLEPVVYGESFGLASDGARMGVSRQSDGEDMGWELREVVAPTLGSATIEGVGRSLSIPPGGEYELDFNFVLPSGVDRVVCGFLLGVLSSGVINGTVEVGRLDVNRDYLSFPGGLETYTGFRTVNNTMAPEFVLDSPDELGLVPGSYTIRYRILNSSTSGVSLRLDDFYVRMSPYFVPSFVSSGYSYRWFRYDGGSAALLSALGVARSEASANDTPLDISGIMGLSLAGGVGSDPDNLPPRSVVNNLPAGVYISEARLSPSGACPLVGDVPIVIEDVPGSGINLRITEESPVTSCRNSNGILSAGVSVNGTITTEGHTFEWYETSELINSIAAGARVEGLSALSYTVRVANDVTGCTVSGEHTVGSRLSTPVLTVEEVNDVTSCIDGSRGSARVSSGGVVEGFEFQWYSGQLTDDEGDSDGDGVLPDVPFFTGSLVDLAPGYYTVRVLEVGNECTSVPEELEIDDLRGSVDIRADVVHSAHCSAPYDGRLDVEASYLGSDYTGSDSEYSFEFFEGGTTALSAALTSGGLPSDIVISSASVVEQLPPGDYTVRATNLLNSCVGVSTFLVAALDPVLPIVDASGIVLTNDAICVGATIAHTGSVDAGSAVSTGGIDNGYLYRLSSSLFSGGYIENKYGMFPRFLGLDAVSGAAIYESNFLEAGTYLLDVKDTITGCSAPATEIRISHRSNLLDLTVDEVGVDTECRVNEGSGWVRFTVHLESGAVIDGSPPYAYEIHRGTFVDASNLFRAGSFSTETYTYERPVGYVPGSMPAHGLLDGDYRLLVRLLDGSNCSIEADFEVVDERYIPIYATPPAVIEGESSCRSSDGSIELNLLDLDGNLIGSYSEYVVTWYRGSTTASPSTLLAIPPPRGRDENNNAREGLSAGSYTVSIVTPDLCELPGSRTFEVPDSRVLPGVSIVLAEPLRSCRASDADGELRAEIVRGGISSDFSYEWYTELLSEPPISPGAVSLGFATGVEVVDRWEGQYAVRVTHEVSGCEAWSSYRLVSLRESPLVEVVSVSPNERCLPPYNGRGEVRVSYGGSEVLDFTGYSFELGGSAILSLVTLEGLSPNVSPGHRLSVSRGGCVGEARLMIGDVRTPPDLGGSNSEFSASRSCDESVSPTGRILVRPDGSPDGSGYMYTWYGEPYLPTSVALSDLLGHSQEGLRSGLYSVKVESELTGCVSTRDFTIDLELGSVPVGTLGSDLVTNCSPFNGSLEVVLTPGGGLSTDVGDYDWLWYEGLDESVSLSGGTGVSGSATGLGPGWYSVRYVDGATSCRSALLSGEVRLSANVLPVFDVANPVPASDCMGDEGEGTVDVLGPLTRRFDISVYDGNGTDVLSLPQLFSRQDVGVGVESFALAAGTYTARVSDRLSGCFSDKLLGVSYIDAPTVVDIVEINPSNCAPYVDDDGYGGAGGASGSVRFRLIVDSDGGITHEDYQIFLYASSGVSDAVVFSPEPDMDVQVQDGPNITIWSWDAGRPLIIQSIGGSQSLVASGAEAMGDLAARTGSLGSAPTPNAEGFHEREYIFGGLAGNLEASIDNYMIVAAQEGEESCFSVPVFFNVPRSANQDPVVEDVVIEDNMSCGPVGTSTGSIEISRISRGSDEDATTASLQTYYEYVWYEGSDVSSALELGTTFGSSNRNRAEGLPSGTYGVVVRKITVDNGDDLGCESTYLFSIGNAQPVLSIVGLVSEDVESCSDPSGSILIEEVDVGSGTVLFSGLSSDYEVIIRSSGNVTQVPNLTPVSALNDGVMSDNYSVFLRNVSTNCQSLGQLVRVGDGRVVPEIDRLGSVVSPNSICTSGSYNGGVSLSYVGVQPVVDYLYRWYLGSAPPGSGTLIDLNPLSNGSMPQNPSGDAIGGLFSGVYTVVVEHAPSDCISEEVFSIPDGRIYPIISFDPSVIGHNTLCRTPGDGSVSVSGGSVLPVGEYDIGLYENNVAPLVVVGSALPSSVQRMDTSVPGVEVSYSGLDAGSYYLRAEGVSSGCVSTFVLFEVDDNLAIPLLESVRSTDSRGCGSGSLNDGSVDIRLLIPPGSGYAYDVTLGSVAVSGVVDPIVPTFSGLSSGTHNLSILNTVNDCEYVSEVVIEQMEPRFRISDLRMGHQESCSPYDGFVRVLGLEFGGESVVQIEGSPSVYGAYTFTWSRDGSVVAGSGADYERMSLDAGVYDLEVVHSLSTCSVLGRYSVEDETVSPVLLLSQEEVDESCSGTADDGHLGVLLGTADGMDETGGYRFTWYEDRAGGPVVSSSSRAEGLVGDKTYVLEATDVSSGCSNRQSRYLERLSLQVSYSVDNVIYSPVERCLPPYDGSIQLDESSGVSPGALGDYQVFFYSSDPGVVPLSSPIEQTIEYGIEGVNVGDLYYFQLTHISSGCRSVAYEVSVSSDVRTPELVLEEIRPNTHCDQSLYNGLLSFSILGTISGQDFLNRFDIEWKLNGFVIPVTQPRSSTLGSGTYDIRVTDRVTECETEGRYELADESINPLPVHFRFRPVLRCVEPYDGTIIADLERLKRGLELSDYIFLWKKGMSVPSLNNYDHDDRTWSGLEAGSYTIVVLDPEDMACQSLPTTFNLEDASVGSRILVDQVSPLTYCDRTRPNGVLEAVIPEDEGYVQNYVYDWFTGSEVDSTHLISSGHRILNVSDTSEYTVRVIRKVSGCASDTTVRISPTPVYPLPPQVLLRRNRTDCKSPNGSAEAIVEGFSEDYTYSWFKEGSLLDTLFRTPVVDSLDIGTYEVYVQSKLTGCSSLEGARVSVFNAIEEKRFRVESSPSLCTEGSGTATIIPIDPMSVKEVLWTRLEDNQQVIAPALSGAEPGSYTVSVTTEEQCVYEGSFEIEDQVYPYNGVSANGDGLNDFFYIDCIEHYPDNKVELYDRDGNRVYIQEGYDNSTKVFAGVGNTGMYLGGNRLPEGTYYYVIEKGDDSSMLTGFLELIH